VGHVHQLPDECTIFRLPVEKMELLLAQAPEFGWFFGNPDLSSLVIPATVGTEYLHHCIFQLLHTPRLPRLWTESLIGELLLRVLSTDERHRLAPLTLRQKRFHLPGIEAVKEHIHHHYTEDLSLPDLAAVSHLSPFHFNRLFRKMTTMTPYQYLLQVRLEAARLQLRHTAMPVTEVAFSTGFNSLEHFSSAYKKAYGHSPAGEKKKSNFP
jgi:AraC family transcriptional regulator